MTHQDTRTLSRDAQEAIRMRAVAAALGGMNQTETARRFGVSRQSVNSWMRCYREEGEAGLKTKPHGRPRGSGRLRGWQAATIVNLITDRHPEQLKLPFVLWTREAVRDLIAERFGITYSLTHVGRLLNRWGFTAQKPRRRAFEQDSRAVRRWLEVEYPDIARQAKRERAEIHWGDEMGVRSDHQTGRSYSPRGRTPVIGGTGKRFGCNMISAITNRGTLRFMVFKGRFDSVVFIEFLRRLIRRHRRKVYLIVDSHPVHKSAKVRRWLEKHENRIHLFLLPTYSPDLNPDEFLNNDVKSNAVGRRRPRDLTQLLADMRGYLRSTQKQPQIVRKYFHAESVRYAAAR